MRWELIRYTALFSLMLCTFACGSPNYSTEEYASVPAANIDEPTTDARWEEVSLPDGVTQPIILFGSAGEIIFADPQGIHISIDDGETWTVTTKGSGYSRCSHDGGLTSSPECGGGGIDRRDEIQFEQVSGFDSAILTDDNTLVIHAIYEHTSAVFSVPLRDPNRPWYSLGFTYAKGRDDTVYGIRGRMEQLDGKIVATAWVPHDDVVIVSSEDAGRSWKPFYTRNPRMFHFIDSRTGLVFSDKNGFTKTTDGGQTWNKIADTPSLITNFEKRDTDEDMHRVTSMEFANENRGYIIGTKGFLIVTNDGGKTWEQKALIIR